MSHDIFIHRIDPTLYLSRFTSQDSTVLRNVGLPLAHTAIALASIQRGLGKLLVNKARF